MAMNRRTFVKLAGTQAGLLVAGSERLQALTPGLPGSPGKAPSIARRAPDIIVVGAGAFGGWTALRLQQAGARVLLVDAWGPGNSRSTSGDETRGVRSSYGDRPGEQGVLWARWAKRAMAQWLEFDATWGKEMKVQHFYVCGDLIFRASDDNFLRNNRANWDKIKAKYEMLKPDEVRYRYPQFSLHDIEYVLYEPDAGTVRARRSCESVAAVFRTLGGELQIARAWPTAATKSKMPAIQLSTGEVVSAGTFVFACGPWLPKVFPNLLGRRIRTPMGSVYYFGPRPGDHRFQYPNCPTWNFPGTTGWPALPDDNSGFRIRAGGGASGTDPDISQRWVPPEALERAKAFAAERFPPLKDCPVLRTHSCHYESGVGRNFMIDLHPDASNVWIVGSGMAEGFKFGPAIGEYAANRILGRDREPELECSFRIPKEEFPDADTSGFGQGQGRGRGQGRGAGQAQGRGTVQGRGRAAGGGGGGQAQAGGRGEAQGGARAAQGEQTQGRGQGRGQAQQQQQFTPIRACAGPVDQ